MLFNILLGFVGILEVNLGLFQTMLGEYYGIVFVLIAAIGMMLRTITTTSLSDKVSERQE
jgi:hypothetical protein